MTIKIIAKTKNNFYQKNIKIRSTQMRGKCPACGINKDLLIHILSINDHDILCCSDCLENIRNEIRNFNRYRNQDFIIKETRRKQRQEIMQKK